MFEINAEASAANCWPFFRPELPFFHSIPLILSQIQVQFLRWLCFVGSVHLSSLLFSFRTALPPRNNRMLSISSSSPVMDQFHYCYHPHSNRDSILKIRNNN